MEKILLLLLTVGFAGRVSSQCIEQNGDLSSPPCNGVISPNPENPINDERSSMKNRFDWKAQSLEVFHPASGYVVPVTPLLNPFHTDLEYLANLNYFKFDDYSARVPANLDFQWEDGWELIKKGNGYAMDETTQLSNVENRIGPYFILYNKYTSQLRVLASFSNIGLNQSMYTHFRIKEPNSSSTFYSSLLSKYTKAIQPLNQPTEVTLAAQGFQGAPLRGFFFTDFRVNYDPCICNYQSNMLFQFGTRNVGDIRLEGRLIGTSTPLDNSGQPPLQNGRDFLTSVFADPAFSVKGGMLTYSNIDKLANLYYTPSIGLPVIGIDGRKALVDLLNDAGKSADEKLAKSAKITGAISNFLRVGPELTALGTSIPDILKALGPIGAATSLLSGLLTPKTTTPSVSVIEAELALTGKVEFNNPIVDGDIEIHTPGSKSTNNPALVPDAKYPIYNEALGTFAVFEKPKVRWYTNLRAYEANSLKYYFNPAVPINLANTKILAALVINYPTIPSSYQMPTPGNMKPTGNINEFSTDFIPLETLHRLYVVSNSGSAVVSLRVQIFYEFLPNPDGKIIRNWEILTYPTETTGNYIPPDYFNYTAPSYGNDVTWGTTNFTVSNTYKVFRDAAISGTLSNSPGVATTIKAGNGLVITQNSVIKSGMSLQTVPVAALENDPPTSPVSATYVKAFCSTLGTQYKAKELALTARIALEEAKKEKVKALEDFSAFPNPSTGKVSFLYYLDESTQVRLNLISTTSVILATPVDAYQEAGSYEVSYDASNLPAGIYIYTLETNKGKQTKRLVILK